MEGVKPSVDPLQLGIDFVEPSVDDRIEAVETPIHQFEAMVDLGP